MDTLHEKISRLKKLIKSEDEFDLGPDYHPEVNAFYKDYLKATPGGHFGLGRQFNNEAFIEMSPQKEKMGKKPTVHLDWLSSWEKGSGAGTRAMQMLTNLADKHGVHMKLMVGSGPGGLKTSPVPQLKKFYKKHGFETEGANKRTSRNMSREPQKPLMEYAKEE